MRNLTTNGAYVITQLLEFFPDMFHSSVSHPSELKLQTKQQKFQHYNYML